MIQPPQHELFVSERPVRSDYSRERVYARRRIITVIVVTLVLGGVFYALWGGRSPSNPADIPTIKSEGPYKQKPADPGGIDIPHQDVQVYDQLDNKNSSAPSVEHLLPPPEAPKDIPNIGVNSAPTSQASAPVSIPDAAAVPSLAPVATVSPLPLKTAILPVEPAAKSVNTTVVPVPVPVSSVPVVTTQPSPLSQSQQTVTTAKAAPLSIGQVINDTKTLALTPAVVASAAPPPQAAPAVSVQGKAAIQLASLPNEGQASALMLQLQKKYATQLGSAKLHAVRADLGGRGVYYRIQSQMLATDEASRICSTLKQINAGCIIVRK